MKNDNLAQNLVKLNLSNPFCLGDGPFLTSFELTEKVNFGIFHRRNFEPTFSIVYLFTPAYFLKYASYNFPVFQIHPK